MAHFEFYSKNLIHAQRQASILWYHLSVLQLSALSLQRKIFPKDITHDLVYLLNHNDHSKHLTKIKGSVTLFNREHRELKACLFGTVSGRTISKTTKNTLQRSQKQAIYRYAHGGVLESQHHEAPLRIGQPWVVANSLTDWSLARHMLRDFMAQGADLSTLQQNLDDDMTSTQNASPSTLNTLICLPNEHMSTSMLSPMSTPA